jgi:formamidopyrimidine-DNA glycosylase
MPELPEIRGLARWLERTLTGHVVERVRMMSIAALKTFDPPIDSLVGQCVCGVQTRGKFIIVEFERSNLAIHLSRAGWVRWYAGAAAAPNPRRRALTGQVVFDHGYVELTEQGHEKRLAIWLVEQIDDVPQIAGLGPDALDPGMTLEKFADALRGKRGTVKKVLSDQECIAGVGNAYSDEILHASRISPLRRTSQMTDAELDALFNSTLSILTEAAARAEALSGKELKDDKRSHFRVHNRTGEPCPVCGDTIRAIWSENRSFQYCPTCQTSGRVYADRRLSRLLR